MIHCFGAKMKIKVELETDPSYDKYNPRPVIFAVWSGIKRVPSTHSLRCLCTKEEDAKSRSEGYYKKELDYYEEDALEWWYEKLWLDHLFGEEMLRKAREIKRKQRTGD